ncbi:DUF2179 domain-containing protein [Thalassobacillus sp. CUG 92003]|uniref:DUF2179 domain-containing protein n=1 Tax=Thalassobacillus sp. CUG 92003 TaxID=2736641 RepID=UPI0015E65C37|nr:DUF2179 domain-containing protein [Thalassobacillus sp. CUG 92003]
MLEALIIFAAQLILIPIVTIRTILVVKGIRNLAAFIGVFEGFIYVISLGLVFSDLSNVWNMVAYALGFGIGLFLGSLLEAQLQIGYVTFQVNILNRDDELVKNLRAAGFGVTTYVGEGIEEKRYRLDVLAKRNREKEFHKIINTLAPRAFVVSYEPRTFKGGFLTKRMRNRAS